MKEHFLSILRRRETDTSEFRLTATKLASVIAHEIAEGMQMTPYKIQTPFGEADGGFFEKKVVLVPILRGGLVFIPPFRELFPKSSVGFFGIQRKEAGPHLYYENLPEIRPNNTLIFVLDPMLATGGTANLALDILATKGARSSLTFLVTFLVAQEGFEAVQKRHPLVKIHTVAIDPQLTPQKFISPGLGDFGNRFFGT